MNEENVHDEGLSLKDILGMLKLHWIVILICTILGAGIGFGVGKITPPQYEASINVYIRSSSSNSTTGGQIDNEITNSLRLINTFIAYIKDKPIAENAASKVVALKRDKVKEMETLTETKENEDYFYRTKALSEMDVDRLNTKNGYKYIASGLYAAANDENTLCITVSYTHSDSLMASVILENVILSSIEVSEIDGTFDVFKDRISTSYQKSKLGSGECASAVKTSKGALIYVLIGLAGGLVLGLAYAIIRELLNNTIRDKSFIENKFNLKIICAIPEYVEDNKNEKK